MAADCNVDRFAMCSIYYVVDITCYHAKSNQTKIISETVR